MNGSKKLRLEIIVDCLSIIWCSLSLITWFFNRSIVADIELFNRLLVICSYFFYRILLTKYYKRASLILLTIVLLLYLYELIAGYLQLFEVIPTNDQYNLIVGSFSNPGPYGGFLAICDVIFIVYYLQNKNKKINVVFIIASIMGLILLPSIRSRAAILSLIVGILFYFYQFYKSKMKKYLLFILILLLSIGTAAYCYKKPSAQGRFLMSKISVKALFDNSFIGEGFGSYSGIYGNQQFCYFSDKMKGGFDYSLISENERMVADCPVESFNDYIKIGIESGVASMIIYLAVIGCSLFISLKTRCIWSYGLIAYSIFALFFFPSRLLLFNVLFPIILSSCVSCRYDDNHSIKYYSLLAFILLLFIMVYLYPSNTKYTESITTWNRRTYKQYLMEKNERVIEGCDTLKSSLCSFPPFLFAYGRTLNLLGDYNKSDSILLIGAKISSDPMFWNVMGNNSLALGKFREAEERYKHAFYMVPNRLYPLTLLAKLYHAEGDTISFLDMAEKVETFIPKVESANTERLRSEIAEIKAGYEKAIKKE